MKYMGSKERICKYIVPIIQSYIDKSGFEAYFESFCGSCSIIEKINCKSRIAADSNKYLIALLHHVKIGGVMPSAVSKEYYDNVRESYYAQDGQYPNWLIGCVGFLASYNGRFFDGGYAKTGIEHTPHGDRVRDYYHEAKENILKQHNTLQGVNLITCDFFDCFADNKIDMFKNMVFLFDPPYKGTKQYANAKDFDYDRYYDICRRLSKNNIVLCCEQNMPNDFVCIWEKPTLRSIKAQGKTYSPERLYTLGLGLDYTEVNGNA